MPEAGVLTLGSIGTRLDLELRAGDTIGPYTLSFVDKDGNPINLTGSSVSASVSFIDERATSDIVITSNVTDAVNGKATITLSATVTAGFDATLLADSNFAKSTKLYAWKAAYVDAAGTVRTLFYGYVWIASKALP
jgi:hypothetical protein